MTEPRPRVAHEDDLCRLWAARAFPVDALVTGAGDRLQIVYPGRRGGTGGPDFHGAILADDGGRLRSGDVELHLRSRDWVAHGHRADPAYNNVVLHVVLEDDGPACLRADGVPVPVLALAGWVTASLASSAVGAPPMHVCRVSPALLTQDVRAMTRAAGRTRLEGKAAALEAQIAALGAEQALFVALLDAAGYSRNRRPCAMLAGRLPVERLQRILLRKPPEQARSIAEAVLLGLAGLLPAGADDTARKTWARYADLWTLPPLHADEWVRAGVRPANFPDTRLRGMAILVARHVEEGLVEAFLGPLRAHDPAEVLARLEVPAAPGERTPPLGRGRAVEMAVNVVGPFAVALARSRGDGDMEAAAWHTIGSLPGGEDSEPLRHMRALLASSGHRVRAPGALEQQGLLHLYHSHCSARACWECPLAGGA